MSDITKRGLNQTATYWGNPTPDGWGGYTFDAPVEIDCRWEDTSKLFISAQTGKEERSRAMVFVDQDVVVGGYLYLGSSTGTKPEEVTGAFEIKSFGKTPSVKATKFLRKAWL